LYRCLLLFCGSLLFVFVFDIPSQKQRKSIHLGAPELLRAQLNAPQSSSNSDLVGEVDVCPSGNPSFFVESENGVDLS
jgi:hypothetical protein